MKKILFMICITPAIITHAQTKQATKTTAKKTITKSTPVQKKSTAIIKTPIDSLSYAVGLEAAAYYKTQGAPTLNPEMVKKAFEDMYNNSPSLTAQQCNMTIQQKLQMYMSNKIQAVKDEGKTFLANNKKRPGVVELPSGMQYEIIKQGTGSTPTAADTIKAHYILTLPNGQEIQNSYKNGEPIQIPVTGVIPGWTQALKMMPVGSKWKLYIPSDLGYGDRGAGNGAIPGGSVLVFDIELLEIVHSK